MEIIDVHENAKYIKFVREKLTDRSIMEQLAEEASELSQASLKCIRACKMSENMTPVDMQTALNNVVEEMGDVFMCYFLFYGKIINPMLDVYSSRKWKRWAERLGYKE